MGHGTKLTYVHPLIATEILKISSGISFAIETVGMQSCIGVLDLELHILSRLISRPFAGQTQYLLLMEELATTALKVDPRNSPSTYHVRDRIVHILEQAHSSIWDSSQVFNHHVSKARRHLALDPPNSQWDIPARREQLELAQKHLDDALNHISPPNADHQESELNLCVSMALALVARSKLEREDGDERIAVEFEQKAESFYDRAQSLDADNSYVLENFARYKLRLARSVDEGREKTRLIVEAIQLLELEQYLDQLGTRVYETTEELANAYLLLNKSDSLLNELAGSGFEPAIVALAKIRLFENCTNDEDRKAALVAAETILRGVTPANATWRSQLPLYRIVSELRCFDFLTRLELLNNLDGFDSFAWPQQLRLEHAILLLQAGDERSRLLGKEKFKQIRDELISRSSSIEVPRELKFLRDPKTEFRESLETFIVVKNVSDVGRSSFGIPDGWKTVDVVFRDYLFGRQSIKTQDELDCLIQFTNFGPQAVPLGNRGVKN